MDDSDLKDKVDSVPNYS